ncbi:MAG TPA: nuclear transport factor 2 family protein [Streptosporangiaceae bacterium]|nr:nuclear transport factor 2 family protein [Streptosporangiaceae bacterium]
MTEHRITGQPTARDLARRSQAAVQAKDREAWLSLFAPDAVVADPIGPSPLDPAGHGHRGLAAITAFFEHGLQPVPSSLTRTFRLSRSTWMTCLSSGQLGTSARISRSPATNSSSGPADSASLARQPLTLSPA